MRGLQISLVDVLCIKHNRVLCCRISPRDGRMLPSNRMKPKLRTKRITDAEWLLLLLLLDVVASAAIVWLRDARP